MQLLIIYDWPPEGPKLGTERLPLTSLMTYVHVGL